MRMLIAAVIVTIFCVLIVLNNAAVKRQLNAWQLLPRHEQLTELFVSDRQHLVLDYTPGHPNAIGFTVVNDQGQTASYIYVITVISETGTQKQTLQNAAFSLASGSKKQFTASVVIPDMGKRVKVAITLSSGQEINYWLQRQVSK